MSNLILQMSFRSQRRNSYPPPVSLLDVDNELSITIHKKVFRLIKRKERGQFIYMLDDLRDHQQTLSLIHPVIFNSGEDDEFRFQLVEDFISSDTTKFKKFIKYSVIFHLIVGISVGIYNYFNPTTIVITQVEIDGGKVKELMEKIKSKQQVVAEKKVEKPAPTPAPTPVIVEKPAPTIEKKPLPERPKPVPTIEKKVAKTNVTTERKIPPSPTRQKSESPKRLVVREPKVVEGGMRKTAKIEDRSGPKLRKSKLAAKSGVGRPNPQAMAMAKTQKHLAASLSFLSSSPSKFNVPAPGGVEGGKKYASASRGNGTGGAKGNVLSKLVAQGVSGGTGGPIRTTGARSIASGKAVSEGDIRGGGKSLNSVQGKVSLNRLFDDRAEGGIGGALGDNRSMQMSGKGKIAQSLIEKALAKHLQKLQYCYEKALLFSPNLGGNLWVKWQINSGGGVSSARVIKSELNDNKLHNCIATEISKISFPSPSGGAVDVQYPFNFSSSAL